MAVQANVEYALCATSNLRFIRNERARVRACKRKIETNNSHSYFNLNHIRSSLTFDHTHAYTYAYNEIRSCFINVQFIAFAWRFRKRERKKTFFIRVIIRNLLLSTFFVFCFFFLHLFVRSFVHSREYRLPGRLSTFYAIFPLFCSYSCFA